MWAAADDVYDPRFISTGVRALVDRPDFGLAFCEMANIDAGGHIVRAYPSFTRFQHEAAFRRVVRFLRDPEILGKANLIYSLFRREACAAALRAMPLSAAWGIDMCIALAALARTQVYVGPDRLFFKRLPGSALSSATEMLTNDHPSMSGAFELDRDGLRYVGNCLRALSGTSLLPLGAVIMGTRVAQVTSRTIRWRLRASTRS